MKKYLTLAAILGAVAFISVSYLAQAEPPVDSSAAPAVAEPMAAPVAPATAPAAAPLSPEAAYAKDSDECNTLVSATTTEGTAPPAEARAAAFKQCMMERQHTEEEMNKAMEKKVEAPAVPATPAAPTAPAAPAPMDAPAAK